MSLLIFLAVLVVLILAHEFGHFIVAKKSGIRVDEFAIGFPPKIFGKKHGETEYTINWLPIGGFVRIWGEDPTEEHVTGPGSERSFVGKPRIIQAAVLVAGHELLGNGDSGKQMTARAAAGDDDSKRTVRILI